MAQAAENVSPPLVAIAGWFVPGAGYWLIGERKRAVTVGVTIIIVFFLGILISGVRCVQAPDMSSSSPFLQRLISKPWFIGQVLNGPLGIGAAIASNQLTHSKYHNIEAKARLAEIGTLYTAVAGMLNLLTIMDAASRAAGGGRR
jgi:hypothetical protein